MRRQILSIVFSALALASMMSPAGAQGDQDSDQPRVIGTWKLVSAKYGGTVVELDKLGSTLKHVTPTGFVWLSYDPETRIVSRTSGGTYTLKGDRYEETPRYGFGADFDTIRDKSHSFTIKIEGDKWHHQGTLSNGLTIDEVWERSKKA